MDLPRVYPITSDALTSKELQTSIRRLASTKITIFQYRRKALHESKVKDELALLETVSSDMNISIIINSYHDKNLDNNFSGVHLTGEDLKKVTFRQVDRNKFFGISCHNKEDILKAESLEADYIFLSPVKETPSHKDLQPLGWENFSELSKKTKLPVYALGGLSKEDLSEAEKNGAYGVAGISRFWSD